MENKIISRITTKNYRNLVNEDGIELNNLNILIGSNGSGKSNLVALLEFFKNCLTPNSDLESRGVTVFQNAIAKLRNNILDAAMQKPSTVKFEIEFDDFYLFSLTLNVAKFVDIQAESLQSKKDFVFYKTYYRGLSSGDAIVNTKDIEGAYFEQMLQVPMNELSLVAIPKLVSPNGHYFFVNEDKTPLCGIYWNLSEFVKKWQFYNANEMDLAKIRSANPKIGLNDIILSKSGENLATVLDNLFNHMKYGLDFEERINNAMKEILPMSRRIKTTREGMSLSVQWYFDGMETPFYLEDMSDGTVRMLCWAIILHSPILPTLLVIDEPELSLHIAWMRILSNWIKQASQKTQIIITTHSPDLLDYFTDCSGDVICFEKAQQKGYFQTKKLPEAILQEKIAEGWQLGDLYRIGDPIIGGWA